MKIIVMDDNCKIKLVIYTMIFNFSSKSNRREPNFEVDQKYQCSDNFFHSTLLIE